MQRAENLTFLLCLYMALSASSRTSGFAGFLRFLVAAFAVLMESFLCRKSLSFCAGLMAVNTQFAGGIALLPGMVAFHTVDLQRLGMHFVVERHFPVGNVKRDHILGSKDARNHQDGEQETCEDPYADQPLFHHLFTPFPSRSVCLLLNFIDFKVYQIFILCQEKKAPYNRILISSKIDPLVFLSKVRVEAEVRPSPPELGCLV